MRTAGQGPGGFEKRDGWIQPGQDLIVAGEAGWLGTRLIAAHERERLEKRFSRSYLRQLDEKDHISLEEWAQAHMGTVLSAFEMAGEGGILTALWNLSGIYHAGIDFDLRQIPLRQITVEICEMFELNPYRLLCGGCLVAAADHGGQTAEELKRLGVPAAVIGRAVPGIARRMYHGGESAGFLERPQPDEIYKISDVIWTEKNGGSQ